MIQITDFSLYKEGDIFLLSLLDFVNALQQPQAKETGNGEMAGIVGVGRPRTHHGAELFLLLNLRLMMALAGKSAASLGCGMGKPVF